MVLICTASVLREYLLNWFNIILLSFGFLPTSSIGASIGVTEISGTGFSGTDGCSPSITNQWAKIQK